MTGTVITSETIGVWLKRERHKHGWSVEDVARMANMSKSTVTRMEKHNLTPNMYSVERVLAVFNKKMVIVDDTK